MRIALVTTSFLPRIGGAEFVVHHLARQWSLQGHEVTVFNTTSGEVPREGGGYSVRRFQSMRGADRLGHHRFPFRWCGARRLGRLLDSYQPDFISAHFGYPTALWLSAVEPRPRFLITCHGPALNESATGPRQVFGIDNVLADALNKSTRAVALSRHAEKIMVGMGVPPERIVLIPNGVDTSRFEKPAPFDLRGRFGLPRDSLVALSVGREVWAKGYDVAIKAFGEAARDSPDVYYVIAGKGVGKWQALARESAREGRVVLCEGLYGDDLIGAYQQADFFVLSSVKETFPLVVVEAMAAGLATIVTDVSGSQDVINDGENGIVVPPGDVGALSVAIRSFLEDDAGRRRFGAINALRAEQYSWDRISRRYLEFA